MLAPIMRRHVFLLSAVLVATAALAEPPPLEIDQPPHRYHERAPHDRFTQLKTDIESGHIALDYRSEKAFVVSLLAALDVPVSSQMLVFSNTSLQLRLISPENPRALYFNDDTYVGYVPGGRIEILSLDPELGAIFYIFDIPRDGRPPKAERSDRCMNCHVSADTQNVPGLAIKSVVPGSQGGSLKAFRQEKTGHGIPLSERFGGWYLTGDHGLEKHWGNIVGPLSPEGAPLHHILLGQRFNPARYPLSTSDLLPQLLHEHQAGFVNCVVAASYRARALLDENAAALSPAASAELDMLASGMTRYVLFADEAVLPPNGVAGDASFKMAFLRGRGTAPNGQSLKDFDLRTHLFRQRCSYMIYSPVFGGMPGALKEHVFTQMRTALAIENPAPDYAYLPAAEKQSIREILRATLRELPAEW